VKFRSSAKSSGTYKRKLTRAGTYRIYCSIHGAADQSMKLVVK
jgi:plastocyanin